jgi:hypothetical protein
MIRGNKSTNVNILLNELKTVKDLIYSDCGLNLTNLKLSTESLEYGACSFKLNDKKIQYRVSKITPLKTGQFVTIWQRNKDGITEPFDISNDLDFIIIAAKRDNNFGQFIFPKSVLAEKGIITKNNKEGKRGIRVYPPWDTVENKQAEKSQTWQTKYFLTIDDANSTDKNLIRKLFFKL